MLGSSQVVYSKNALLNNCQKRITFWNWPFCFQSSFECDRGSIDFSEGNSFHNHLDSHDRRIPINGCLCSECSLKVIAVKGNAQISGSKCANVHIQSWTSCTCTSLNGNLKIWQIFKKKKKNPTYPTKAQRQSQRDFFSGGWIIHSKNAFLWSKEFVVKRSHICLNNGISIRSRCSWASSPIVCY